MVIKSLVISCSLLLPVVAYFYPVEELGLSSRTCHIRTLNVREEARQTVITRGQWWLSYGGEKGHGLFYGRTKFINDSGIQTREVLSDRSFTFVARLEDRLLETETSGVSRISGDKLSDAEIERWISPVLIKGHTNHTTLFRTPGGSLLSGLPGRPGVKCDDHAGPHSSLPEGP